MVAKWPKHVGEIFRVLDNTYVLMCCLENILIECN